MIQWKIVTEGKELLNPLKTYNFYNETELDFSILGWK